MAPILERIFGDDEQVTETESSIVEHSLQRAGVFHEADRIHSDSFKATEPDVTYMERFVEGSGTVQDLAYTGSVLPGNISTRDGDIHVVIDTYRDEDAVDAPDTGTAAVSNFYTRDGDISVVVNDWDDTYEDFSEVRERIKDSPNFQADDGTVEVLSADEAGQTVPAEDRDGDLAFLTMGGYVENALFTREAFEEDWYSEASGDRERIQHRLEAEKEALEQEALKDLYHGDVVEVASSERSSIELSILDERKPLDEWRETVEDEEMLPFKVEYNQHPGSFYKRDRYKVASEFIEEGIDRLEEAADQEFLDFMDAFRTEFDRAMDIDATGMLERVMDSPATDIALEDGELSIGVTTQVEMDLGILGMLPYQDQLEDRGAELPDPIGDPATVESEIEGYSELDEDVRGRLTKLADHEIIGLEVDEDADTAELLTTNHRSNESVTANLYSTWAVDELAVGEDYEEELYSTMVETLLDAAGTASFEDSYGDDTTRDLVRYELYNTVEEALDLDWDETEADLAFDQYRDRIEENRLQNTLVDRGLGEPGDMHIAVQEYVDRR